MADPVRKSGQRSSAPEEPTTLHELLVAWQKGRLSARQTMALTGMDTIAHLYQAAASSGVPIRKTLLPRERLAADLATAAIRKRLAEWAGDDAD